MNKKIIIVATLVFTIFGMATKAIAQNKYIKSGESLTFAASFSISGVMTDIAEVKMETSTVSTKSRQLLRLKCTAATFPKWDSYFRVRDLYESYVDPSSLKPFLFKRNIEEGTYKKELKYLFNRNSGIATSTLNKKGYNDYKTEVQITSSTLDIVSTIYNTRALDFESMSMGQRTTIELIVDSEVQQVTIEYVGKEFISVASAGSKECYKLSIGFGGSEIEDIKGGKYIWISADNDRLPVLIKANIPVGNVQIRLIDYQN